MKQHLKIMAALACLMGLGSTAVMAANWTDTLQQLSLCKFTGLLV